MNVKIEKKFKKFGGVPMWSLLEKKIFWPSLAYFYYVKEKKHNFCIPLKFLCYLKQAHTKIFMHKKISFEHVSELKCTLLRLLI